MDKLHGKWLGGLAVLGLLALGDAPGVQAHGALPPPPLSHAWHPPHPPLPSIAVNFPPLVLGSPHYYPAPAYPHQWAPRPYVRHEHYHYHGKSHGHHGHKHHWHGHGHHGHHHHDDD